MERFTLPPRVYDALQYAVHGDYADIAAQIGAVYDFDGGKPALELGCGTGALTRLFRPDRYVGVDLDPDRVAAARKKHPAYEFAVGDASCLDAALLDRFDFLFCHAWIHHIDDPSVRRILASLREAARRRGRAVDLLVIEPLLPDTVRANPVGYALGKLDRGRYVRTRAALDALFGGSVVKVEPGQHSWYWPVPSAAFTLRWAP